MTGTPDREDVSGHAPVAVPLGHACGHCEEPWPCTAVRAALVREQETDQ